MSEEYVIAVSSDSKIEPLVKEIINSPADQVILEVAPDSTLLNNEINLRLIKFYADEEMKTVIINAVDPVLIALAQRLGISTIHERVADDRFTDGDASTGIEDYQGVNSASPQTARTASRKVIRYHGGFFPALLVAFFTFILAVWWFFQPKATVIVYPKEQFLNFRTQVTTGLSYDEHDVANGKIPAKLVEKNSTIEVETPTTGHKVIGVNPAVGKVTVINSTGQPLVIPKGTTFISKNGMRFLADRNIMVPKKTTRFQYGIAVGEEYGRAEIPITAAVKGTVGNVSPKTITRVEGKYARLIIVVNFSPTSQGMDKKVAVVTLDDVKTGEAEARKKMLATGPKEVTSLVAKNFLYIQDLTQLELIRLWGLPDIGETADILKTRLEYRVSSLTPSLTAIHKYLALQLKENMPRNFEAKNNDVNLISVNALLTQKKAQLELLARGKIHGVLNHNKIKRLVTGKTVEEANKRLSELSEVADFQVKQKNGSKSLPAFAFQIRVICRR